MRGLLLVIVMSLAAVAPPPAIGQQRGVMQVNVRAEIAAALFTASATQAAELRAADQRLRDERARIQLIADRARAGEAAARSELSAVQERYIAELAARDAAFAQEISIFRGAVEDIASTPEGAAALARFNAGDQAGALSILDDMQRARARARDAMRNIEEAAEKRHIAQLALQALGVDGITVQSVLERFKAVTYLDPNVSSDWVALSRLYFQAGRAADALDAGERAVAAAQTDNERVAALQELAEKQRLAWRVDRAASTVSELANLLQRMIDAAPNDTALRLRYADALLIAAQISGGGHARQVGLILVEQTCKSLDDPEFGEWIAHTCAQSALERANTFMLTMRRIEMGPAAEAALAFIDAAIVRHPTSLRLQDRRGDALEFRAAWRGANGDRAGALADWQESLALQRAAVARDPTNVARQHVLFTRLHAVAGRLGDLAQARALMDEAFAIVESMPFEPDDIAGQESLGSAYGNASAIAFRQGDYNAAANYDVRRILSRAQLHARFPNAPRTFTNLDANLSRQLDWRSVPDGMRRWREIMDQVLAQIEAQPGSPGYDWRFPLVLTRIWNCTAYRYARDFAAGERECDAALTQAETLNREFPQNTQANRAVALALVQRGNLDSERGDYDAALGVLNRSLSTMVTKNGHFARAHLHANRGEWRLAITDMDAYNRISPGDAVGLARICRYRAIINEELNIAERDCRESLRLSATRDARVNLGLVHLRQGDHAAAIAEYDRVLGRAPNDAEALYGRGLARHRLGQASTGAADMAAAEATDAPLIGNLRAWGFAP